MADYKLKDFFNAGIVAAIAGDLAAAWPGFDRAGFATDSLKGLDALELLPRGWHIAEALRRYLPPEFPEAAAIISASLPPEIEATGNNGMAPFKYLPHVFYVQKYGLEHFDAAMSVQEALTARFSCESSIRPFIERYPEATYARLQRWAGSPNAHLRRLASEGTRPRLPWAPRLRAFQKDPAPVIALLDLLKDDPALYVRRSVANNINDIGKDHPDLAVALCRGWWAGASKDRQWIVRHALRSLVKKGHRGALEIFGAAEVPQVTIGRARLDPPAVRRGGKLRFSFELASTLAASQQLLVDFAVHFVKAGGKTSAKVFKLRKLALAAGETAELSASVNFAEMTTRRHYPGRHRIEVLVNGVALPLAEFDLV